MKKYFVACPIIFLFSAIQVFAAPAMPQIAAKEQTKECAEFFMGDECSTCRIPDGWVPLSETSCPAGYNKVSVQSVCLRTQNSRCCSNGSSAAGFCDNVVVNESFKECAFAKNLNQCESLPTGWSKAKTTVYGDLCPSIFYKWIDDVVSCYNNNSNKVIYNALKGNILLQVEGRGEAWYLDPVSRKRFYLKNGNAAYSALKKFGLGITNGDLEKISIGDLNMLNSKAVTNAFADKLKGRILIQVQSKGEAWYVRPSDGKRYYMANGESAYQIMKKLSLGITNKDLDKIEQGFFSEAGKSIFINSIYNMQFIIENGYYANSNDYGVMDPAKARDFCFSKKPNPSHESVCLSPLVLPPNQKLIDLVNSIYDINKKNNYTVSELEGKLLADGSLGYQFALKGGYENLTGGELIESSFGGKVVFLSHGGQAFEFLQKGADIGLENIVNGMWFVK